MCAIQIVANPRVDPKRGHSKKQSVAAQHASYAQRPRVEEKARFSYNTCGAHKRSVGGNSSLAADKLDRSSAGARKMYHGGEITRNDRTEGSKPGAEKKRSATSCEGGRTMVGKAQSVYTQSHKLLRIIENKLEAITAKRTVTRCPSKVG